MGGNVVFRAFVTLTFLLLLLSEASAQVFSHDSEYFRASDLQRLYDHAVSNAEQAIKDCDRQQFSKAIHTLENLEKIAEQELARLPRETGHKHYTSMPGVGAGGLNFIPDYNTPWDDWRHTKGTLENTISRLTDRFTEHCRQVGSYDGGGRGWYVGGELVKNWGWLRSSEYRAGTDIITNEFTDRADPIGGGFLIGYRFTPFSNSIVVSPFASFDFVNSPVNHTFANGSYLGTTANFMGTFGVKAGPQLSQAFWLYGIAGVSVLNETLKLNFIPVYSSQSAWVAGGTLGVGGAWKPDFLQGLGRPVSVFAEYHHTWWQDAQFNTPAASPGFNYTFARQDDVLKVGFTVDLSAAPPPPVATMYRKALPAK